MCVYLEINITLWLCYTTGETCTDSFSKFSCLLSLLYAFTVPLLLLNVLHTSEATITPLIAPLPRRGCYPPFWEPVLFLFLLLSHPFYYNIIVNNHLKNFEEAIEKLFKRLWSIQDASIWNLSIKFWPRFYNLSICSELLFPIDSKCNVVR